MEVAAIVVGAGPAGLAAADRLRRAGIPAVVLERANRVGARWRGRYDGLRLNTMRQFSGLPGRRMPRALGRYPERDAYVGYLEDYARALDVRFGIELERVDRAGSGRWRLITSAGDMETPVCVIATGYDAVPRLPDIPGLDEYAGDLIHSRDFRTAVDYTGRDVLIVGAGNTGIDIAGLLDRAGARVKVAMRTPPNIFPRDLWGAPLQPSGIPAEHLPAWIGDSLGQLTQRLAFGDLTPYGIARSPEGYQSKFRSRLVSPAVDDGFVAGLKAGRIEVTPTVERFAGSEVVLVDDRRLSPDLVVCATGYRRGLEPLVGHLGVLLPDGRPSHDRGAPAHPDTPGLYFAGFAGYPSGQLRVFPAHARRIARAARRRRATAQTPEPVGAEV